MRSLVITLAALCGFVLVASSASAQYYYGPGYYYGAPRYDYDGPRYYHYRRGYPTWNGCPPDWTVQGGVCKPYRHGPWDWNRRYYRY